MSANAKRKEAHFRMELAEFKLDAVNLGFASFTKTGLESYKDGFVQTYKFRWNMPRATLAIEDK